MSVFLVSFPLAVGALLLSRATKVTKSALFHCKPKDAHFTSLVKCAISTLCFTDSVLPHLCFKGSFYLTSPLVSAFSVVSPRLQRVAISTLYQLLFRHSLVAGFYNSVSFLGFGLLLKKLKIIVSSRLKPRKPKEISESGYGCE